MTERIRVYRGWKITRDDHRPVTGIYRAERHGVGMCAGDREALLRMIDTRAEEERIERDRRAEENQTTRRERTMKTIDINATHGIALVKDEDPSGGNYRYVPLATAPEMTPDSMPQGFPQTYLGQMHYVASHIAIGLQVHDRMGPNGERPPRQGWKRWSAL